MAADELSGRIAEPPGAVRPWRNWLGSPVPVTFGSESSTILDLFDLLAPNLASRLVIEPFDLRGRAVKPPRRSFAAQAHADDLPQFRGVERGQEDCVDLHLQRAPHDLGRLRPGDVMQDIVEES